MVKKEISRTVVVVSVLIYLALIVALMRYLDRPWNWAFAGLVLLKGLVFWAVIGKAAGIGRR